MESKMAYCNHVDECRVIYYILGYFLVKLWGKNV